jgi:hypothetical protein
VALSSKDREFCSVNINSTYNVLEAGPLGLYLVVSLADPHGEGTKFCSRNNDVVVVIDKSVNGIN